MRILTEDTGEWTWGKSLLLKSGVLGMGIGIVLLIGWPPSPKSQIIHASPSDVLLKNPVDVSPAMALSQKRGFEYVTKKSQERKRPVSPVAFQLDLNASSRKELERLPGIGPVLADRIVTYRLTIGDFQQIAELVNVIGIGAKRLQRLQPFARVEGATEKLES